MDQLTFAAFLTPAGIAIAGGLVAGLIAYLKGTFPTLDARVSGALLAFVFTFVVYALTAIAVGVPTLDAGLNVFAAWLTCGLASIGVHGAVSHIATVTRS